MRLLERPGLHSYIGDLVKTALVGDPLFGPRAHDYFQRLLEALAALVARHPETLEVHRDRAAPRAVLQPPAGQQVGGGRLLGGAQWMMERQQRHRGAEANALGALRGRDRDHQRRRHDREIFEKVQLGQPRDVEAELVGAHDLLDRLLVAGRLGLVRGAGQLVEKTELHGRTPLRTPSRAILRSVDSRGAPAHSQGSEVHCTPLGPRQPEAPRDVYRRGGCYAGGDGGYADARGCSLLKEWKRSTSTTSCASRDWARMN